MDQGHTVKARSIDDLVDSWTTVTGDSADPGDTLKYGATRDLLHLLSRKLYADYQPFPEGPPFLERLALWLDNLRDDENAQKLMFEFVPWLLFIGRHEMETMYRAAFTGPISRWIIDEAKLNILDPGLPEKFSEELKRTFFGCLAGMDIGSFIRINSIDEQGLRPDFRVLSYLLPKAIDSPDSTAIRKYLQGNNRDKKKYIRIVAVEDIVGTGSQMTEAAKILKTLTEFPTLICPIVAAGTGTDCGKKIAEESPHICFQEYFRIPFLATVSSTSDEGEPHFFPKLRDLIQQTWPRLKNGEYGDNSFGYTPPGSVVPGSLVLTFLNCPNSVPPFFHRKVGGWEPLFPRLVREA